MSNDDPSRRPPGPAPRILVAGLFVIATSTAAVGCADQAKSSATAARLRSPAAMAAPPTFSPATPASLRAVASGDQPGELGAPGGALSGGGGGLGVADGLLPNRTTAVDERLPGVAKLDPALLGALQRASTNARHDGVDIYIDSGWRSRRYQVQLFRQAVTEYGSAAMAARWVAVPGTSMHESGDAVDIGPAAAAWLSRHGARYGLCQIYRSESWHYELRPGAIDRGCPRMYADPAHDPRLQR